MRCLLFLIFLSGIVANDNGTFENSLEVADPLGGYNDDQINQGISSSEWAPCSRSCGGGIARQQKQCRRKPCKGRPWNIKYKVCNVQPCEQPSDPRAEQCAAYDNVPYTDRLLKWYPYYDPSRPCALVCRGHQPVAEAPQDGGSSAHEDLDSEEAVVVQFADKVEDGTRCYKNARDVCINGECMKVGCDMRVGSNKNRDACGVCGGDGSTCNAKYAWTLELTSACSESCGGGFKIATSVCKSTGREENTVDSSKCEAQLKPEVMLLPCNTQPCSTKWLAGEWTECSVTCGGGSRSRAVFCIEENGNATSKLADYKCSANHKPKEQEICNAFSCPMWEAGEWSDCSSRCGPGVKRRSVECRDGHGRLSRECEASRRPRAELECAGHPPPGIDCSTYGEEVQEPLMQAYAAAPEPEKLADQPVPSQSTFIADEWSPCSVTCGEGIRHRRVHCKIFLEFSQTIAKLPDSQCSGPKPTETEKCSMGPCDHVDTNLAYRMDTAGDSSYAEASLTDSFHSSSLSGGASSSSAGSSYETKVKVAPGSSIKTTYSWKEVGYTDCSATCLGGVQDLIITCVRDDTGKSVTPLLCTKETKPESRIRVCNDHPCPPRWNTSEFSPCTSLCGLGIHTREVTCIHEVTNGPGNTVVVPNKMCPQPPPVDRQYCNVWDCPVQWHVADWGKCSKSCGGGTKRRKVSCEQVMAQGRKQSRAERDCPTPKPRSEKECNPRPCEQLSPGAQPIIISKNTTYVQDEPGKKVNLDIGGQATIFQGTPVIKIRCPVKKFDKAHIIWRKDEEELRKSRKHKINKKGALKIVDINFSDSGTYSCWAGQTRAAMHLTVKPKPRDLMSNEEVLRSGNTVQQRQGTHLGSAPVNSEPFYDIYSEGSQESRQESQNSQRSTEKPRRKKQQKEKQQQHQQQAAAAASSGSTGKYDYSVTPLHQPVESTATSGASTMMPEIFHIITTIKSLWPMMDRGEPEKLQASSSAEEARAPTMSSEEVAEVRASEYDFFRGNTAIPDRDFGPDEERIFIDEAPFETEELGYSLEVSASPGLPSVTMLGKGEELRPRIRHQHGLTLEEEEDILANATSPELLEEPTPESRSEAPSTEPEEMSPPAEPGKPGRDLVRSATPVVLGPEDKGQEPTIGPVAAFKAKDDLLFEWVTTDWSRCSQTCGGGGFQMRGAQCTVRSAKNDTNATKVAARTVIGASLCEDAGYPMPEKVRTCGAGKCPQWYAGEWSSCETSRCFNWKTAMQRREISCRLSEEAEDKTENSTNTDPSKCDEAVRPPQRQECYNDACKGVWRVGEWSECTAACEEDGIKYRILQCVWFGTKKPAGNACRDISRPAVMKTCRGAPCIKSTDDCKDHSQLCGRVKLMGMCRVPLYEKLCCKSCHQERRL